ncbi:TPM domain-containing protein [Myroides phaeus]|uniref:TLP18.3, Psb32 and MOLO-1 founding protein of phosphatase n=1 Tax=Myroides phaeus TaxID=702745 RepID=A0A1G8BJI0_9FLAO|nr:TPM domain-containing protein [Myroides phaeus]MEC4117773.1 TPM domain-containing protein [Myroides phaeus]SDH33223.1 TLP18.3, Psb32 and MOLO-1 founding protein of phosphatase [Myroides phaeus]
MATISDFLSTDDENEIIKAIEQAEKNTSGEIRVHIETSTTKEAMQRAQEVFFELDMNKTSQQNAVLFYICINSKAFVILGDKAIDEKVKNENFWEGTKELVINHFKQGLYKQGLIYGILKAGSKLKVYFPSQGDNKNELPNEISKA